MPGPESADPRDSAGLASMWVVPSAGTEGSHHSAGIEGSHQPHLMAGVAPAIVSSPSQGLVLALRCHLPIPCRPPAGAGDLGWVPEAHTILVRPETGAEPRCAEVGGRVLLGAGLACAGHSPCGRRLGQCSTLCPLHTTRDALCRWPAGGSAPAASGLAGRDMCWVKGNQSRVLAAWIF